MRDPAGDRREERDGRARDAGPVAGIGPGIGYDLGPGSGSFRSLRKGLVPCGRSRHGRSPAGLRLLPKGAGRGLLPRQGGALRGGRSEGGRFPGDGPIAWSWALAWHGAIRGRAAKGRPGAVRGWAAAVGTAIRAAWAVTEWLCGERALATLPRLAAGSFLAWAAGALAWAAALTGAVAALTRAAGAGARAES